MTLNDILSELISHRILVHGRDRYLHQYLNMKTPQSTNYTYTILRKKIINVHGYPKVVSRLPVGTWRKLYEGVVPNDD